MRECTVRDINSSNTNCDDYGYWKPKKFFLLAHILSRIQLWQLIKRHILNTLPKYWLLRSQWKKFFFFFQKMHNVKCLPKLLSNYTIYLKLQLFFFVDNDRGFRMTCFFTWTKTKKESSFRNFDGNTDLN